MRKNEDGFGKEQTFADLLDRLGLDQSLPWTRRVIRRVVNSGEYGVDHLRGWLDALLEIAEIDLGHASTPLDRVVGAAVGTGRSRSIDEAAHLVETFQLETLLEDSTEARPSIPPPVEDSGGDPPPEWGGSAFCRELWSELNRCCTPARLSELLAEIDSTKAIYKALATRVTNGHVHEFIREARGLLRRRWGEDLTPADLATLMALDAVHHEVIESLRARPRRRV